jgi:hypothetical protein
VQWTIELDGTPAARLTGRAGAVIIPLVPTRTDGDRPNVTIKIANLCCENPIEWPELRDVTPATGPYPDRDFRYNYTYLVRPPNQLFADGIGEPDAEWDPVPEVVGGRQSFKDACSALRLTLVDGESVDA